MISSPPSGALSLEEALSLLQQIESKNVQALSSRLSPVKASAAQSLKVIGELANEMEREKIKLEGLEQRYKSVVENSRKTIVTSLKREAAVSLELPQSVNDAKKFKEKFEAMMNRIGEVTGSHSKMLNNFMKKQANKMKEEFEALQKLQSETKTIISEYEQSRLPVIKCSNLLNTASQKASSIALGEDSSRTLEKVISETEQEIGSIKSELDSLMASSEFEKAEDAAKEISEVEKLRDALHDHTLELFSHAARAFTKYSYGITKETERRLQVMSLEPWKILYERDISLYSSLLFEVRKSVGSGNIQLKDSDRMVHYLDTILESLPDLQKRARTLEEKLNQLQEQDSGLVARSNALQEKISMRSEQLERSRQELELQKRQTGEKKTEVDMALKEAADVLHDLTGQQYSLKY